MTCREKLAKEHPECVREDAFGGCLKCPYDYGYVKYKQCIEDEYETPNCTLCWDQEVGDVEATETSALYADNLQVNIHKIIDDAMEKKDRCVSVYISESGVSVTVTSLEEPTHWERIVLSDDSLFGRVRYRCSNCKITGNYASHFCPACGEEMHGVKEVKE